MINSLDIDACMLDAKAKVETWTTEFQESFYRKQREAAIGAWWNGVPDMLKDVIKMQKPDLYKKMEEGNYGSQG